MADQDLLIRPDSGTSSTGESENAGRTLPANVEAEAAFLGAVLIDNRVVEDLDIPLGAQHFYAPIHGRIFDRVLALIDRNATASPVTLKPYFEGDEGLSELGGTTYLAQLTSDGQGLLAPRDLAQQIYDLAMLRELVTVGRDLVENALDTSEEVEPLRQIEEAEAALFQVAEGAASGSEAANFRSAALTALKLAETAMNSGGGVSGKTTGLDSIDEKTAGLHDSDLIILAGRPGMGKSSLAMNIAFNCAYEHMVYQRDGGDHNYGAPAAFFSLEMSADQLATRVLAEQAEVSSEALRSGTLKREEFQKLAHASQVLTELPLYIDDTPALSISGLRQRARRLKRKHDIGLIVVDYLQLMQGSKRSS